MDYINKPSARMRDISRLIWEGKSVRVTITDDPDVLIDGTLKFINDIGVVLSDVWLRDAQLPKLDRAAADDVFVPWERIKHVHITEASA